MAKLSNVVDRFMIFMAVLTGNMAVTIARSNRPSCDIIINMNFELILWWLVIYAFLGWCVEVIYATASRGIFVNRGFLSGPYCPIYGFGALLVLWVTAPFADGLVGLFLASMILCSVLELVAGWLMEVFFKQRWWDYSDYPFNIGGYVCLEFSLLWGLACVFMIKIIQPMIVGLTPQLTSQTGLIILGVIIVALLADLIATINQMLNLKKQLLVIDEIDQRMRQLSDGLGEKIHGVSKTAITELTELKQKKDELLASVNRRYRRLIKAFPDSRVKQFLTKPVDLPINKILPKSKKPKV